MHSINLDRYGGAGVFTWDHEYLTKVLTTGKIPVIKSINLKHAFRTIKREDFVPENMQEIAYQDKEIDIGYGCILTKPTIIAEMLALMDPKLGGTFLDIGTGSGYVAALMGMAAGENGKVFSLERVQFLVDIARMNLSKYPEIKNTEIVFRDGSQGLAEYGPYDGIHISAAMASIPEVFTSQLKVGAKLVAPTIENDIRVIERKNDKEFREIIKQGYFFDELKEGIE